ncbi:MAG TPA: site-specific integrase [Verrucomicrobiae bacterium]|jgi:integrase|nr:site-specific integrase [Verrucomicrobiae bacterium]
MKRNGSSKPGAVTVGNVTVKIYKRVRSTDNGQRTVFEVSDYSTGARRLRGFTDEGAAKREAERIARQLATGETTAATMRNSEAASYGRAIELLRPLGTSLELAVAHYVKACEILGGDSVIEAAKFYTLHRADKIERRTVKQTVAELITAREARGKSNRYVADLRARLNRFADGFAVDIGNVTGPDVQGWLDGLKVAPRTAKNFRSSINTLFSFAESHGYILKNGNPVSDTEEISTENDDAIEIYSPAEIIALLEAAPASFAPVIAIGAFAGLRTAEIERLEWSEIDLKGGHIEVKAKKAKTRSRRLVPILPNLQQWLASFIPQTGNVWKGTANALIDARAETTAMAGVEWKNNALRHSFISYRLAEIQSAAQVSLEAGNSPAMVFKNYREVVKPDAAKAWFAVAPEAAANIVPMAAIQ